LIVLFALAFALGVYNLAAYLVGSAQQKRAEADIRAEIRSLGGTAQHKRAQANIGAEGRESDDEASEAAVPAIEREDSQHAHAPPVLYEQIRVARARNPDIVGMLRAGSDISTYVVQRDNGHYLNHDFYGKPSQSGAVFADVACSIEPPGRHILLHGHNMKDGTVFGKLHEFRDPSYIDVFPVIRFSTPSEDGYYAIFSVLELSVTRGREDYFDVIRFHFMSDNEALSFAEEAKKRSLIGLPVETLAGDRLLTLMTCTTHNDDSRFAIMARKLREGEAPEDFLYQIGARKRVLIYREGRSVMSGPDVQEVQEALFALGYLKTECDGLYGQQTADAVRAFQADNGLEPDGIVGERTRKALFGN